MAKPFTKTQLIIAFSLLIILTIIPSVIYIINFSSHHTSSDPANWGTFGDFIGGTTNVILSIINIIITAYIAYLIKTLDDKRFEEQKALETQRFEEQKKLDELRHQQNLDFQLKLFLTEKKSNYLDDYKTIYSEISTRLLVDSTNSDIISFLQIKSINITAFLSNARIVFDFLKIQENYEKEYNEINKAFTDLINEINKFDEYSLFIISDNLHLFINPLKNFLKKLHLETFEQKNSD